MLYGHTGDDDAVESDGGDDEAPHETPKSSSSGSWVAPPPRSHSQGKSEALRSRSLAAIQILILTVLSYCHDI